MDTNEGGTMILFVGRLECLDQLIFVTLRDQLISKRYSVWLKTGRRFQNCARSTEGFLRRG